VELFEQIRREYEFGVGTISGVANKLNIHRRMVREAIGSALPVPRKKVERPRWKLAAAGSFVDQILEADKKAPRKQRHTAHRIWERIQREMPQVQLCERTVRGYVHERKLALGLTVQETFVPQSSGLGADPLPVLALAHVRSALRPRLAEIIVSLRLTRLTTKPEQMQIMLRFQPCLSREPS